jgi:coenzyme PQQ precursor peptide PqqA
MKRRHCRHENNERIGLGELTMKVWKTPRLREICVGMEINSYACARL